VGEWATLQLGKVCTKIGSGATPRGGNSVYLDSGKIALVRSQNVYNDGFHREGIVYLTNHHAAELANVEVVENDVLLNITGDSVARVCQIDPEMLPARVNQHVAIIRPDPHILCPRFLRYFLVSPDMQAHMLSLAGAGATRNALTKGMIESFEVLAPLNVAEQRTIANILGTLDDKIERNRRMNETLEAMARALFKSWFVDFDPVRAEVEGRDPGLPKHLADLFPNSFEESELGAIPYDWQPVKWGDLVSLEYGKALTGYEREVGDYAVYGTNGRIGTHTEALCPHAGIIVGRKGAYRGVHYCDAPFFVIDTAFYVVPKVHLEMRWAYYKLLQMDINSMDSGSAIPSTSRKEFYGISVVAPPVSLQESFVKLLRPVWLRQEQNDIESRTLAALRDTLLPKLISGELRVKDAEQFLEERGL
jgi:type I restriction enzyme S subunit